MQHLLIFDEGMWACLAVGHRPLLDVVFFPFQQLKMAADQDVLTGLSCQALVNTFCLFGNIAVPHCGEQCVLWMEIGVCNIADRFKISLLLPCQ